MDKMPVEVGKQFLGVGTASQLPTTDKMPVEWQAVGIVLMLQCSWIVEFLHKVAQRSILHCWFDIKL